jgi:BirA family biotin operon repressor/biotin-[acetyl-CoA-carboxylase] ligase
MDNSESTTRRDVLDALAVGPVSGPDLAARLDVSRAAIWKHVEALREDGFSISSGESGYRVTAVPEYGANAIKFGLDVDFDVEYHEALDSTNARARELATAGAHEMAVVADRQTGGRGRLDRQWASPAGGVYLTLLCRPNLPVAQAPIYTLAAAVATTRSVRELGVDAGIKWPNDVLINSSEQKVSGILTEMEGEADRISWIVVGIGVNANVSPTDLPDTGTSLLEQVGKIDRARLVQTIISEFDTLRSAPATVLTAWREQALTLGQRVRVETSSGAIEGEAVDVTFPGALLVKTDEQTIHVTAGDCEHLRPIY